VPGWSGSPPCRATCPRPVRIAQADRLARALGTTLSEMLAEVERKAEDRLKRDRGRDTVERWAEDADLEKD
jgi:hypothetical protein